MKRVVHFEIHATDPLRAIAFYQSIFSWKITKWEGGDEEYWLITTGVNDQPWINGGLLRRNEKIEMGSPSGFVCTIDVPSIDEYSDMVVAHGGMIVVSKVEISEAWWVVYCKDTEGNIFGMIESTMEGMM